jgi:hypothetical protein
VKLRMVLLAALLAGSLSLPGTASARIVSVVWTCNSDGYEHVVVTNEWGQTHEFISSRCGPDLIAFGGGFNLLLSDNTRVTERGQAFLNTMETGEIVSPRRVPARDAEATRSPARGMDTIHLKAADVGPRLAAFFTQIDRNWNAESGTLSSAFSIFDRWGNLVGGRVLVPGDMALTISIISVAIGTAPANKGINAQRACRDLRGNWREEPAGVWGCWKTARLLEHR